MAFDLDGAAGVKLDFAGTEYDGLEVTMRPASIGALLQLAAAADELKGLQDPGQVARVMEPLADVLVDWNLTRGGKQVPAALEGLMALPPALFGRIIAAYVAAQSQADPNLPAASSGGETELEAQIPMTSPPS